MDSLLVSHCSQHMRRLATMSLEFVAIDAHIDTTAGYKVGIRRNRG
jgi:hypothetical protein